MHKKPYVPRLSLDVDLLEEMPTKFQVQIWGVRHALLYKYRVPLSDALEKYGLSMEEWEAYKPDDFDLYFNPDFSQKEFLHTQHTEEESNKWCSRRLEIRALYEPKYKKQPLSDFFDVWDFIDMLDGEMSREELLCGAVMGSVRQGIPLEEALIECEVTREQYDSYINNLYSRGNM